MKAVVKHDYKIHIYKIVASFYAFIVVFMPSSLRSRTRIYSISASYYISPQIAWLSYSFSAISILAVILGLTLKKDKTTFDFRKVIFYVMIYNFIRLVFGLTNLYDYRDFSLILCPLAGYGCYRIITHSKINVDIETVLDLIILINFISQIVYVFTGKQMAYGGRYAALGSSVGAVGLLTCQYLIYYVFARRSNAKSYIYIFAAIASLILSGSRSNLLFAIGFICIFAFKIPAGLNMSKSKKKVVISSVVLMIILALGLPKNGLIAPASISKVISRMQDTLFSVSNSNSLFEDDTSLNARIYSIGIGLKMIASNVLGISASAIDLQQRTISYGYSFFPHSTLISYYLLWGAPVIYIIIRLIKIMRASLRNNNTVWIAVLCYIVIFALYGAPILSEKTYFWCFLLFDYMKRTANNVVINKTMESDRV